MNQGDQEKKRRSEEISFMDLVTTFTKMVQYIKHKWVTVLMISIFGALLGLSYSILKKPTYTAVCTFVLEEPKTGGGLGQYAGLAALAGVDLGSQGAGGIFQGDNILELYTSRTMIEKALLSYGDFNGKKELLIDRYIDHNYRDKWIDDDNLKHINFNGDPNGFNRQQDSIVSTLVELFNKSILFVTKPDKKLNIINVTVTTKDELFSKYFTEKLVQNVNDFYVQTKTKNANQNVQILQRQSDSVKKILNNSINGVASANEAAPNANPQLFTLRVSSQKKQVDVQSNTAIYTQVVQNLELAKISLRQQMPLIQVIDKPVLPLFVNHVTKLKGILIGLITGFIISIFWLIVKKIAEGLQKG